MASFSPALLRDSDQGGVRAVARELLHDAMSAREKLLLGEDPEALHDFRVAVRRLRSWLRSFEELVDDRDIRRGMRRLQRLARATSPARDAEVLISWLESLRKGRTARQRRGITWLLDEARNSAGGPAFDERMSRDFDSATRRLGTALPVYRVSHHLDGDSVTPVFAGALSEGVRRASQTLQRRLATVRDASDDKVIHRARIAGKRLRYLLEPMSEHVIGAPAAIDALKKLQDTLGNLHDAHVWNTFLRERAARYGAREASALLEEPEANEVPKRTSATDIRPGLLIVARELRERVTSDFAAFEQSWSNDVTAPFFADVDRIADELNHWTGAGTEIERKYLLRALPTDMPPATVGFIEQGYLPGTRLVERLRRTQWAGSEVFHRNVKSGVGLMRLELEEETTRALFEALWPHTAGRRVTKRRHRVDAGELTWEIDEFTDRDLVLAEVELPTAEHPVEIPAWLEPFVEGDVTGDPAYANSNLAR